MMSPAPPCLEQHRAAPGGDLVAWGGQNETARRAMAQQLARAGDVAGLAARLMEEPAAPVRAALFDGLAALPGPARAAAAACLLACLNRPDIALRNGAVAALKSIGADGAAVIDDALDENRAGACADVRLLAVEVLRAWPAAAAVPRLEQVLLHDSQVNVCAAAAEVAAAVGAPSLVPALRGVMRRFPDHPYMRFCAQVALSRLAPDAGAVPAANAPLDEAGGGLRDIDVLRFIAFYYGQTGVRFAENRFYYIARQLAARAAVAGCDSRQYLDRLIACQPAAELAALRAQFWPGRTTFFAPDALPAALAGALPLADPALPVWVLAADAGQTAYSLALHAAAHRPALRVMADLCDDALAGRYDRAALNGLDAALAQRWFTALDGGDLPAAAPVAPADAAVVVDLWGDGPQAPAPAAPAPVPVLISPQLRARVTPLARDAACPGGIGLIYCDHVLPFESAPARQRLAADLYDALCPGGFLCLGAGETLSRTSALFTVVPCAGGVVFQKPLDRR